MVIHLIVKELYIQFKYVTDLELFFKRGKVKMVSIIEKFD